MSQSLYAFFEKQRCFFLSSEAATRCILYKKVFLKISQNLQENTRARVSFLIN